jgi:hypothetical protein
MSAATVENAFLLLDNTLITLSKTNLQHLGETLQK